MVDPENHKSTEATVYSGVERRSGTDRRENHIPFFKHLAFKGQRKSLRRADDRRRITVLDRYHPPLLVSILVVLGLSLLDGVLTLILIERGARELNPIMRYYLGHGPVTFVMVKYGITALAILVMLILGSTLASRRRMGTLMIPVCGALFGSVVIWELYLLAISKAA